MGNGWLDFIISIFASVFIMSLSGCIGKRCGKIKRILAFYGENSLLILCLHLIEINVVGVTDSVDIWLKFLGLDFGEGIRIIIIYLVKVVLLTLMVFVLKKFDIINKVFYPKNNSNICKHQTFER